MDRNHLLRELYELLAFMSNEGILSETFETLESIQETQPNFMEDIITNYFSSSTAFMNELQQYLLTKPLDPSNVERVMYKLKGGSASIGAAKLHAAVEHMIHVFKAENTLDRLNAAFERVKVEHVVLKTYLGSYAELLQQLRFAEPPDEESDNQEDIESTKSNNDNDNDIDIDIDI